MIYCDTRYIKKLERDLDKLSSRALPYANRNAINSAAFQARVKSLTEIDKKMITRNTYTKRSIRVEKAAIGSQRALVGSTVKYMAEQEFGHVERKGSATGVAIQTSYSAGQGYATKRTRMPRRAHTLGKLKFSKRKGASRSQRNAIAVATSLGGYAFLDFGRKRGVFKIPARRKGKIHMVADVSQTSISVKPNAWLKPAADAVSKRLQGIYTAELGKQIKRELLFRSSS